jgi:hypothetical protein
MKRKSIIFLIAATTFLSGFGGLAALLAGAPALVEKEPSSQPDLTRGPCPPYDRLLASEVYILL